MKVQEKIPDKELNEMEARNLPYTRVQINGYKDAQET